MRFLLSLFVVSSHAFTPVFIGEEFREESFLSRDDVTHIKEICGIRHKKAASDHPWAVSIMMHDQNRLGGSLISPFHILTVAHGFLQFQMGAGSRCLATAYRSGEELRNDRVVVYGGKCIRGESEIYPNHPDCPTSDVQHNRIRSVLLDGSFAGEGCERGHDFAIIELQNRVVFSADVTPICLPEPAPSIQEILTVAGWGRSYIFNESGPLLHNAPMLIDKHCRRPWSDKLPNDAPDFLCATSLNITDYNAARICHGDSGSGMEQVDRISGRSIIIGMTSFGTKGCPANLLARFTRVNHYLRQICKYTGLCNSK